MIDGELKSYYLVKVVWFKCLLYLLRFLFGKLVEIWYRN